MPLDVQHQLFIGRSATLDDDNLKDSTKRTFLSKFNAFENGHEFFADYQPHNMGVFSFDNLVPSAQDALVDYTVVGFHSRAADDPLALSGSAPTEFTYANLVENIALVLDSTNASDFRGASVSKQGPILTHGLLREVRFQSNSNYLRAPSVELQELVYTH